MKGLTLVALILVGKFSFGQLEPIQGAELERFIAENHRNGKHGFEGLYTKMVIELEDFQLLQLNFEELKTEYKKLFDFHSFYLDEQSERLIVIYRRSLAGKVDFLKIFKEVMATKMVRLYMFEESVLIMR